MARPRKVISSKSHALASQQGPFPLKVLHRLKVAPLSRLSSPFLCPQAESSWPHRSPTWLQPPSLWAGRSFPLCPLPGSQLAGGHLPQILSGNSSVTCPHPNSGLSPSLVLWSCGLHCHQLCLSPLPHPPQAITWSLSIGCSQCHYPGSFPKC